MFQSLLQMLLICKETRKSPAFLPAGQVYQQHPTISSLALGSEMWLCHAAQSPDVCTCSCTSIALSPALTALASCQARCPHEKAVSSLETICCLHLPKPITVLGPEQSTGGHNPPAAPPTQSPRMPGSPTHGLEASRLLLFLVLSSNHLPRVRLHVRGAFRGGEGG